MHGIGKMTVATLETTQKSRDTNFPGLRITLSLLSVCSVCLCPFLIYNTIIFLFSSEHFGFLYTSIQPDSFQKPTKSSSALLLNVNLFLYHGPDDNSLLWSRQFPIEATCREKSHLFSLASKFSCRLLPVLFSISLGRSLMRWQPCMVVTWNNLPLGPSTIAFSFSRTVHVLAPIESYFQNSSSLSFSIASHMNHLITVSVSNCFSCIWCIDMYVILVPNAVII